MTTNHPYGNPVNPATHRASLDAVLLTQAVHNRDGLGQVAILAAGDPYSIAMQLAGFLIATLDQYEADIPERLDIWRALTAAQCGEVTA